MVNENSRAMNSIPNPVIGAVSSVLAGHYYNHSTLDSLFMESGAPGDVPEGNCEKKCVAWLRRCNDEVDDPLGVLSELIRNFMALSNGFSTKIQDGQERIRASLAKSQLIYTDAGNIVRVGCIPAAKSLTDYFREGDFSSIEAEFKRAMDQVDRDRHVAITAASSIIEALCKTYIEAHGLDMPSKQNIGPLWKVMQNHLNLNFDKSLESDQKKMLSGLVSIIDGVGAYRTHIGSAHGRGSEPPNVSAAEARLAINAAHTVVLFGLELWQKN
jgi:hypothetical protein